MRADTQAVSIDAPPDKAVAFLADVQNLPRWAIGFATAVRRDTEGLDRNHGGRRPAAPPGDESGDRDGRLLDVAPLPGSRCWRPHAS
jgi:hypothetical protein